MAADNRDLNYAKYFSEGERASAATEDYNSHNTRRLDSDEMADLLRNWSSSRQQCWSAAVRRQPATMRQQLGDFATMRSAERARRHEN